MAETSASGVLDTWAYIDLGLIAPDALPEYPELTRAARTEVLGAAVSDFEPLPFDGEAAARYGTLGALVISAGRDPRPRRTDLMIAAIASSQNLPLYTRNAADFKGLESVLTVQAI